MSALPRVSSARIAAGALLVVAILVRARTFSLPHLEGDERIYAALLEQIRAGKGYTLQGHAILSADWMIADQYGTPLFYHPPGALAWFALFVVPFGASGWEIATLAAFVVFVLATVALARELIGPLEGATLVTVVALASFTPIAAHVSMHRWLDAPLLAAAALAAWLLARAARAGTTAAAVVAGLACGAAMLVKMNAALAAPGLAAVAWAAAPDVSARAKAKTLATAGAVAALCVAPWLAAEWRAFGTLLPGWAGRPSSRLVAENPFVHQVTAVRTPWVYLRLLPQTVWSLFPSLAILAAIRPEGRGARIAGALVLWITVVVAAHMVLGAIGYSKLLRYVVTITPATVVLAGMAAAQLVASGTRLRRGVRVAAAVALAAGIALECAHGVQVMVRYPDRAWIRPLVGEPG